MTSSVNVSTVQTANTFDQWRIQTNLLKDDVNEIARGDFTKPTGNVTLTVGRLVLSNAGGTTLDVTANTRISGRLSVKDILQDGGAAYFYTDSADIQFRADGNFYANGNTRTRYLFNNNFISAVNVNASGLISTTGATPTANLMMNVGDVLMVRTAANSSNVYITGNLIVSNVATIGNTRLTLANITTANITTANVLTLNVNTASATAEIRNLITQNISSTNTVTDVLRVLTQANVQAANITSLEVDTLVVTSPISAPSESDSSEYRLRVSQTTKGDGKFGVYQGSGSGSNGNASIIFNSTSGVWQMTANDNNGSLLSTVITTANVKTSYAVDTANAASLTAVKGANDNATAAYAQANTAANTVRVMANSALPLSSKQLNFVNTATVLVSISQHGGDATNANIAFNVDATNPALIGPQGVQGVQGGSGPQGSTGAQGIQGPQGVQGVQGTTGIQGVQGIQGLQGVQGISGVIGYNGGVVSSFNSGQTNDVDPGPGVFAFNNAVIGSVTYIYIDDFDYFGTDRGTHWSSFDDNNTTTNRGQLVLSSSGSSALGVTFRVTGTVINGTGYRKIPVAYVSGTMPTNAALMSFVFAPTGQTGSDGLQGIQGIQGITGGNGTQGATGAQGIQGITGTQGAQGVQGRQGIYGNTGNDGSQGATGSQGVQGRQGTTGTQGTQGITGTGTQGTAGTNGTQGTTGSQGVQGITGSGGLSGSGSTGTLAYWSGTTSLSSGPTYSGGAIYASDFIISSDARLKDIQNELTESANTLNGLRTVRYSWNSVAKALGMGDEVELGVIAQEVQNAFPEAVVVDSNGYLSVKYDRLVPVLIEAIKSLDERVTRLEQNKG